MKENKTVAQLRIPSHGRGMLRIGGKPGNRGGGRPPCAIRAACRKNFAEGIKVASTIAMGRKLTKNATLPTHADMIRALNILGRYGFAETETVLPDQLVPAIAKILADHISPDRVPKAIETLIKHLEQCPDSD